MPKDNQLKDPMQEDIENNACGPCKAMGLPPPCKGHRGGGGGSSDNKSESRKKSNHSFDTKPHSEQLEIIHSQLLDGKYWSVLSWLDNALNYEKPEALLSMQIDQERGILTMKGRGDLSAEEKEILQQFFATIKIEFEKFKQQLTNESITTDNFKVDINDKNDTLTIKIPPQYFLLFVMQLIENNLLPTKSMLQPEENKEIELEKPKAEEKKAFNPSPLSTKPRPQGHKGLE